MDEDAVWRGILHSRCGNIKKKVLIGDISVVEKSNSIWWRDMLLNDNYVSLLNNNFSGAISVSVGIGEVVTFWFSSWAGLQPLHHAYPELLAIVGDHHITVVKAAVRTTDGLA